MGPAPAPPAVASKALASLQENETVGGTDVGGESDSDSDNGHRDADEYQTLDEFGLSLGVGETAELLMDEKWVRSRLQLLEKPPKPVFTQAEISSALEKIGRPQNKGREDHTRAAKEALMDIAGRDHTRAAKEALMDIAGRSRSGIRFRLLRIGEFWIFRNSFRIFSSESSCKTFGRKRMQATVKASALDRYERKMKVDTRLRFREVHIGEAELSKTIKKEVAAAYRNILGSAEVDLSGEMQAELAERIQLLIADQSTDLMFKTMGH